MISTTKVIGRLTITVEFYNQIAASIRPLVNEDGTPDEGAIAEYEEFIVNALEIFDRYDFEVLEEAESDRSHSMYYSFVKHDDIENKNYKYILFIRISDHSIDEHSMNGRRKYYSSEASKLKQPETKRKQTWKFKDIIVNDKLFSSYDDALFEIEKRISNL